MISDIQAFPQNTLRRKPNWPRLLNLFLNSHRRVPFEWGINDCVLFACDAVLAMTGTDIAQSWRGRYTTRLGAARIIAGMGAADLAGAARLIGLAFMQPQIAPRLARRGDVVLLPFCVVEPQDRCEFSEVLGIVSLDGRIALAPSSQGLQAFSLSVALAAWRI